ncbi:unnamed protein product [Closterium sp. Naga37s-1]|nr:unnamed protein product [Closterium sp. Naga37s-1]
MPSARVDLSGPCSSVPSPGPFTLRECTNLRELSLENNRLVRPLLDFRSCRARAAIPHHRLSLPCPPPSLQMPGGPEGAAAVPQPAQVLPGDPPLPPPSSLHSLSITPPSNPPTLTHRLPLLLSPPAQILPCSCHHPTPSPIPPLPPPSLQMPGGPEGATAVQQPPSSSSRRSSPAATCACSPWPTCASSADPDLKIVDVSIVVSLLGRLSAWLQECDLHGLLLFHLRMFSLANVRIVSDPDLKIVDVSIVQLEAQQGSYFSASKHCLSDFFALIFRYSSVHHPLLASALARICEDRENRAAIGKDESAIRQIVSMLLADSKHVVEQACHVLSSLAMDDALVEQACHALSSLAMDDALVTHLVKSDVLAAICSLLLSQQPEILVSVLRVIANLALASDSVAARILNVDSAAILTSLCHHTHMMDGWYGWGMACGGVLLSQQPEILVSVLRVIANLALASDSVAARILNVDSAAILTSLCHHTHMMVWYHPSPLSPPQTLPHPSHHHLTLHPFRSNNLPLPLVHLSRLSFPSLSPVPPSSFSQVQTQALMAVGNLSFCPDNRRLLVAQPGFLDGLYHLATGGGGLGGGGFGGGGGGEEAGEGGLGAEGGGMRGGGGGVGRYQHRALVVEVPTVFSFRKAAARVLAILGENRLVQEALCTRAVGQRGVCVLVMDGGGMRGMAMVQMPRSYITTPSRFTPFPLALCRENRLVQEALCTRAVGQRGVRVLVMDGGGMRGMAMVQMLRQIEGRTGRRVHELFDLVCGTSTGGMLAAELGIKRLTLDQCDDVRVHELFDLVCGTSTGGMLAAELGIKRLTLDQCDDVWSRHRKLVFSNMEAMESASWRNKLTVDVLSQVATNPCSLRVQPPPSLPPGNLVFSNVEAMESASWRDRLEQLCCIRYQPFTTPIAIPVFNSSFVNPNQPHSPLTRQAGILKCGGDGVGFVAGQAGPAVQELVSELPCGGARQQGECGVKGVSMLGAARAMCGGGGHNAEQFEQLLQEMCTDDDGDLLIDSAVKGGPKVFVVSTLVSVTPATPFVFRNYQYPPGTRETPHPPADGSPMPTPPPRMRTSGLSALLGTCKMQLWQAIRASSAAPYYFDDFAVGPHRWQDGAIFANNPTIVAVREARLLWPDLPLDCVVSLGCGSAPPKLRGRPGWRVADTGQVLAEAATSVEQADLAFESVMPMLPDVKYYCFNPGQRLPPASPLAKVIGPQGEQKRGGSGSSLHAINPYRRHVLLVDSIRPFRCRAGPGSTRLGSAALPSAAAAAGPGIGSGGAGGGSGGTVGSAGSRRGVDGRGGGGGGSPVSEFPPTWILTSPQGKPPALPLPATATASTAIAAAAAAAPAAAVPVLGGSTIRASSTEDTPWEWKRGFRPLDGRRGGLGWGRGGAARHEHQAGQAWEQSHGAALMQRLQQAAGVGLVHLALAV